MSGPSKARSKPVSVASIVNGYPSDETIDELYDEMDFQRAVQAYSWGLPMVEMAEWARNHREVLGARHTDFTTYGPSRTVPLPASPRAAAESGRTR